jgi:hypothetical protein
MSDPDLELQAAQMGAIAAPQVQTSRLAILSFLSGLICLPGLSGLLGVALGLMALRQIGRSQYVTGENLAWMGILSGALNLVIWGGVGAHVARLRQEVDGQAAGFLEAWARSEADGEAAAAPGLATVMHRGRASELREEMLRRFGPYKGLGPRSEFHYQVKREGIMPHDLVLASYPVEFQNGAPVTVDLQLASEDSVLKVVGYHLDSPLLRDFERTNEAEAHGEITPTISEFGSGPSRPDPKQMKSFNKK